MYSYAKFSIDSFQCKKLVAELSDRSLGQHFCRSVRQQRVLERSGRARSASVGSASRAERENECRGREQLFSSSALVSLTQRARDW